MRAHITATVRTCFMALRQIRSVRRSLTLDALLTLFHALVIIKLDFCCSTLAGMCGTLLQRLQSVLNAAARLLYSARRSKHTTPSSPATPLVKSLERIKFQFCVLVHRCLHNNAPPYLVKTLHLTTEVDARHRLRLSTIGDRALLVAAACAWNCLPLSVRTVSSLNAFWDDLKTVLFRASFDDRTWLLQFSLTTDTHDL